MMKSAVMIMAGIGFTLGVVFGLLLQLPIDNTLPADSSDYQHHPLSDMSPFRSRRSLSKIDEIGLPDHEQGFQSPSSKSGFPLKRAFPESVISVDKVLPERNNSSIKLKPLSSSQRLGIGFGNRDINAVKVAFKRSEVSANNNNSVVTNHVKHMKKTPNKDNVVNNGFINGLFQKLENLSHDKTALVNDSKTPLVISVKLNLQRSNNISSNVTKLPHSMDSHLRNIQFLMSDIVNGILWTRKLEQSCPRPFQLHLAEAWRRQVEELDVVKMEEGCGRMQNRLITFRDSSKACARYRLNTDQIQGEIFSYYLARIFNVSNIPPTALTQVDTLSPKWKTVHLQLSLAQWADSKLVVITQHINGLLPAHIPIEFREEGRKLEPTATILGSKSHSALCELVQWSDLIVFDYLTANLDRVINNMFNRQWNDQMMSNPAHNLEKQADGSLVFLDNESGLFHGYRLLEKYSSFHQTLLGSLCVFRLSTVETIRRLHTTAGVGEELHKLFTSNEVLHKHLAVIPNKNIKILQHRIGEVYKQIQHCEELFNR